MTAASRTMMSLQVRSNNLANVNTPGFRADLERAQAVAVEGYGYDSRHMAVVENNGVSLAAGPMIATGRELDFAVKGSGLIVLQVDRIRLVDVPAADLMKNEAGLLVTRNGQPAAPSENVRLASGFLESSNVSAIDELASTMSLNRLFETQVKMMKAAEDLSDAGNRMIRGS